MSGGVKRLRLPPAAGFVKQGFEHVREVFRSVLVV